MVIDMVNLHSIFGYNVCANVTTSGRTSQFDFLATPARGLPTRPTTPRG